MKRILSLVLALTLILSVTAAAADATAIDGKGKRHIKINKAKLNPSAEEMIENGISPTTGREIESIVMPEGAVGLPYSMHYTPVMVQISNAGGGVGDNKKGQPSTAPIGIQYADVVYEARQATGLTRFSAVFADVIPYYVGFVRSTRLTHIRLRQEWNSAYCTSGYAKKYVKPEITKYGVRNPEGAKEEDPGLLFVGDFPKVWKKYVKRLATATKPNNELFELANIMSFVYLKYYEMDPKSEQYKKYAPFNHTFKFTDEPAQSDDIAEHIEITFGAKSQTDSILEYDPETNTYLRYVPGNDGKPIPYRAQNLINPQDIKKDGEVQVTTDSREYGEQISFTNVIVQAITMKWKGNEQPDPTLTGSGNADYFMGGKHYTGVWERKNMNDRTVFYGKDGNEISLLRGKTLIILMDYDKTRGVKYEEAITK